MIYRGSVPVKVTRFDVLAIRYDTRPAVCLLCFLAFFGKLCHSGGVRVCVRCILLRDAWLTEIGVTRLIPEMSSYEERTEKIQQIRNRECE